MLLETQPAHPFVAFYGDVFARAIHETTTLILSRALNIVIGLALNALAMVMYYAWKGWGSVADKVHFFLMLVGANALTLLVIFGVNLVRAPYLLFHDQVAQLAGRDRIISNQKQNVECREASTPSTPVPPPKPPQPDRLKEKIRKLSQEMRSFVERREKQRPRGTAVAEQLEYDAETGRSYRNLFKTHADYVVQIMRASGIVTADDFYCLEGGADVPPPKPSAIGQCADYLERVVNLTVDRDWDAQVKELKQKARSLCRELREFNQDFERQELAINSRFVHTPSDSMLQERTTRMKAHGDEYLAEYSSKALDYRSRLLAALYIYDKELHNDHPPEAIATATVRSTDDIEAVARYLNHLVEMLP